jgi:uncharacterized protein YjbI with pentapeptide repeats
LERLEGGKAYYSSRPQQRGPQRGAPPPGDLRGANLGGAILNEANLAGANLVGACLGGTYLSGANLSGSDLTRANLHKANFLQADLSGANLSGADLSGSNFLWAHLGAANLTGANLIGASFLDANLSGADLSGSDLLGSNLVGANLRGANLRGVNLRRATLVDANLADADLTGCHIYGISAWNLKLSPDTKQQGLIITPFSEPKVTVDDLEVAQFVYLLLHNEKIRHVIDTVGKKGVLLLGRFTEGRLVVLERLRDELRKRGYLPIVFNFDKPETKDFTETVRLLAGMSKFVIVDLTSPKSAPYELSNQPEVRPIRTGSDRVPDDDPVSANNRGWRDALRPAAGLVDQLSGPSLPAHRVSIGRQADRDDGRGNHRASRDAVRRTRDAES